MTAGFNKYRAFSDNGFFVCQQYLDLLGRTPDTGGYNYWVGLLSGGQVTRGQVADAYFVSPEFQGNGMFIISAYIAVMGRNPDYAGWLYWLNNLWAGTTQQQVINTFIQSTEFQTTYGALVLLSHKRTLSCRIVLWDHGSPRQAHKRNASRHM